MSTRSLIGYWDSEKETNTVTYCHADGSPTVVGKLLRDHYSDFDKIKQLISLGSISKLRKDIGEKHNFDLPIDNWTVFYTRDRRDRSLDTEDIASFDDVIKKVTYRYCNFLYLFKDGQWKCYDTMGNEVVIPMEEENAQNQTDSVF